MARIKDVAAASRALELRINNETLPVGCLHRETVVVRKGPQAYKTATLWFFGNLETGELRSKRLTVQAWNAKEDGPGFDFSQKDSSWTCEDDEIDALMAFLSGQLDGPGLYHRIGADSPLAAVVQSVEAGDADAAQLAQIAQALADAPNSAELLARHGAGQILLNGIQSAKQKDVIEKLKLVASDPAAIEGRFQQILDGAWWMFGGRFVEKANRRSITVLDQLDIPLIRADGALHIVELKTANISNLVVKYRGHYIVGPKVNEAVGQTINYLRELDEQRHVIKGTLGIECRRAFATVVIGHPQYVLDASAEDISDALRTYNAHLSRVEVITYADLIQGAEGALAIGS